MSIFIKKIVAIILIILLIYIPLNILYRHCDYFSDNFVDVDRFRNVPAELQLINLGSSHGLRSFDYTQHEDLNAYNLAAPEQKFNFDLRVLQQYRNNLADGAIIVIPVSYMSFAQPNEGLLERTRIRSYNILNPKYIIDFDISDYFLYRVFPVLTADTELINIFKKYKISQFRNTRNLADIEINEVNLLIEKNKEKFLDSFEYNSEELINLEKLITYCIDYNLNPILVGTPVLDLYTAACKDIMIEHYYENIDYIISKYDIDFYNYTESEVFCSNYEYFYDTNHLLKEGAQKFTEMFLIDIGYSKISKLH